VLDGWIYIAGGIGENNADSDRAYRYDPESDRWERIADLPFPHHHMPLAVANDSLYAIGGLRTVQGGFEPARHLWLYDVDADRWVGRAGLLNSRGASAVGVVGGKLVVVGGYGFDAELVEPVDIYDPATNSWSAGADIPTPRDHLTAAAVDGIVYAIGGRRVSVDAVVDAVEAYDLETDEWTTRSPMPTRRAGLGSTASGGRVYVYGGEEFGAAFRTHAAYDPSNDTWESLPRMLEGRHGAGVAAVGGRIFVIGGGPDTGFSQSTTVQVFTP
jgi:N-acetylneuraminic acid mutarotase